LSLRRSSARNVASQRRLFTTPRDVASGILEGGNHYINDCAPRPLEHVCPPRRWRGRNGSGTSGSGGSATRWERGSPAPGAPCSSRRLRKSSCVRGGSWCGSHQAGRTWIGIVGCASACVPPRDSRSPSLWLTIGQPVAVPSPGGGRCAYAPDGL
jgi:hypothetical protein